MYGIIVLLVRLDELLVYCTLPHRYLVILAGFPQLSSFLVENECSLLLGGVRCTSQKKICEKKKKAWCWHAVWNSTFRAPHPQSLARRANINFFLFSLIFYLAQRTSPKKRDCSLSIFLVTILPMKRERGSIRVKCQKAQYK